MAKRKVFSREFKLEAVRMLEKGETLAVEIARNLGIRRNQLYKWREQLTAQGEAAAFPGRGRQAGKDEVIARLKRELERVTEERDILKKAARFFARDEQ